MRQENLEQRKSCDNVSRNHQLYYVNQFAEILCCEWVLPVVGVTTELGFEILADDFISLHRVTSS